MNTSIGSDRIENIGEKLNKLLNRHEFVVNDIEKKRLRLAKLEHLLKIQLKAKKIFIEVEKITHLKYKTYIEHMVTLGIATVFDRPYRFLLDYRERADRIECYPLVQDGNNEPESPRDDMGVGMIDIVAITFRAVYWSLAVPKSRPIFFYDEPLTAIGEGEDLLRGISMVKSITDRLKLQVIVY